MLKKNKAIFLDRDGVIVKGLIKNKKSYAPKTIADFKILPKVQFFSKKLKKIYKLIIVTNQPDVGRGLIKRSILNKMHKILKKKCNYDDMFISTSASKKSLFRKPNPGMLIAAIKKYNLDIKKSYLIGDRECDMLAAQNSYGAGGTSYGLFNNDKQMSLDLGFTGFRRGSYDFYKQDWKYLNDPTMRGGLTSSTTGASTANVITGLLVPAGSTTVYDQVLGKNAKRPFLHVRYRASEAEDRRYKTWITGSAGGAATSDLDAMEVNFLSERCVCTLGANNFVLFRYGS